MSNEFVKYGTTRVVTKPLYKGDEIKTSEGVFFIKEDSLIDVVEVFRQHATNGSADWFVDRRLTETIRPKPRKPAPVAEPPPPSLWSRFWAWLTRKQPIPQARLIDNAK